MNNNIEQEFLELMETRSKVVRPYIYTYLVVVLFSLITAILFFSGLTVAILFIVIFMGGFATAIMVSAKKPPIDNMFDKYRDFKKNQITNEMKINVIDLYANSLTKEEAIMVCKEDSQYRVDFGDFLQATVRDTNIWFNHISIWDEGADIIKRAFYGTVLRIEDKTLEDFEFHGEKQEEAKSEYDLSADFEFTDSENENSEKNSDFLKGLQDEFGELITVIKRNVYLYIFTKQQIKIDRETPHTIRHTAEHQRPTVHPIPQFRRYVEFCDYLDRIEPIVKPKKSETS